MWGDNPRDFDPKVIDCDGTGVVDLPSSEKLWCGCVVHLEWLFAASGQHPAGVVAMKCDTCCIHRRDLTNEVERLAGDLAKELFRRYQSRFVSP